jgi:hypothetical protein
MRIITKSQTDIWPSRRDYHVLTYAEEGFAPLNIHATSLGIEKRQLVAFADSVNQRFETGSLHPSAPISAVPRALVRDGQDAHALKNHIAEFLRANVETIKATKIICDFRTPSVPSFIVAAIEAAMESADASVIQEVVIIE